MRLIDANDVKKRGDCYPPNVRKVIANILSHTKTVKDAVVVVRCKDCKHYTDAFPYNICEVHESEATDPEDFCSYGEMRDGSN